MSRPVLALIDCNNFFVSCERIFRPDLEGRPVVVLSSNDGCAVARSNEAKALGIPMGAPAFQLRQNFNIISGNSPDLAHASAMQGAGEARREPYNSYGERVLEPATPQRAASSRGENGSAGLASAAVHKALVQFSANFDLYGDISQRITRLLARITPRIEVYSVDESFLDLSELPIADYVQWGKQVRERVWREVGIPVSIGFAPTKTLAKIATERAKKDPELDGVLNLIDMPGRLLNAQLAATPIRDVWGVGWRLAPKLKAEGITSALHLKNLPPRHALALMGIHGRQMVAELNGASCFPLEQAQRVRQSVMHGRLFGEDTSDKPVIEAAIASLTARAARRLRSEGLLACTALLQLATNRHKPGYRRITFPVQFNTPVSDPGIITSRLTNCFEASFNPHIDYHRADILLYNLVPAHYLQTDLFGTVDIPGAGAAQARMAALDAINARYGKDKLHYAAEDLSKRWQPRRNARSPRYTTNWEELPVARLP